MSIPVYSPLATPYTVTFCAMYVLYLMILCVLRLVSLLRVFAGTQLTVYDNVVQGEIPSSDTINVATGVKYYTEVQSYTRGYPRGYGNYSSMAVAVASRYCTVLQ